MNHIGRQSLLGACARAATAREASFRIDYPNARGRVSKVIALDADALAQVEAADLPAGVQILGLDPKIDVAREFTTSTSMILRSADGSQSTLEAELDGTDLVVLVSSNPKNGGAAEIIGRETAARNIMTTGVVITHNPASVRANGAVLALRPHTSVLAVASDANYLAAMLSALKVRG